MHFSIYPTFLTPKGHKIRGVISNKLLIFSNGIEQNWLVCITDITLLNFLHFKRLRGFVSIKNTYIEPFQFTVYFLEEKSCVWLTKFIFSVPLKSMKCEFCVPNGFASTVRQSKFDRVE